MMSGKAYQQAQRLPYKNSGRIGNCRASAPLAIFTKRR